MSFTSCPICGGIVPAQKGKAARVKHSEERSSTTDYHSAGTVLMTTTLHPHQKALSSMPPRHDIETPDPSLSTRLAGRFASVESLTQSICGSTKGQKVSISTVGTVLTFVPLKKSIRPELLATYLQPSSTASPGTSAPQVGRSGTGESLGSSDKRRQTRSGDETRKPPYKNTCDHSAGVY